MHTDQLKCFHLVSLFKGIIMKVKNWLSQDISTLFLSSLKVHLPSLFCIKGTEAIHLPLGTWISLGLRGDDYLSRNLLVHLSNKGSSCDKHPHNFMLKNLNF